MVDRTLRCLWHAPPTPDPSPPLAALAGGEEKRLISTGRSVRRAQGLHTLYISPLKALAVDIARNLEIPEIDDSAGTDLGHTPPGAFLRLAAALPLDDVAPVPLLALLKHPLAAGGEATSAFRAKLRALERAALRGPRPAPGFAGIEAALAAAIEEDSRLRILSPWLA